MKNVFGIVGWSGSGKTHLICRIIKYFDKKKINICSIKQSHHNFEIDKKGKDSYEHLKSGSKEVVINNEYKFAMITTKKKKKINLKDIVDKFSSETDIILIEGLKKGPTKKIEVFDVSGAGDTVLAVLSVCVSNKVSIKKSLEYLGEVSNHHF